MTSNNQTLLKILDKNYKEAAYALELEKARGFVIEIQNLLNRLKRFANSANPSYHGYTLLYVCEEIEEALNLNDSYYSTRSPAVKTVQNLIVCYICDEFPSARYDFSNTLKDIASHNELQPVLDYVDKLYEELEYLKKA